MFQDTLVALDWDGKTPIPYLAKSWTVSPDGKLYTFKLRDDVQFCSGKKFTAEDVVYSFKRLKSPEIKGPFAWRAGDIKELRAPDPYTVEYELAEPFSELLLQLTMFTNVIHNKESVEALGKDYGVKGVDGTGPWCFDSWQPRTADRAQAPRRLQVGALDVPEQGPGEVREARHQDRAGGFEPRRRDDGRAVRHHAPVPAAVHRPGEDRADAAPCRQAKPNFQLLYFGFKTTRPMVADKRVREAMSIAINRAEIAKGILLGNAEPAFTIVDPGRARPRSEDQRRWSRRTSSAPRSCSTRPAGSPAPTASAKRTA